MVRGTDGTIINVFPSSDDTVKLEIADPYGLVTYTHISLKDALTLGSGITHLGHGGQW